MEEKGFTKASKTCHISQWMRIKDYEVERVRILRTKSAMPVEVWGDKRRIKSLKTDGFVEMYATVLTAGLFHQR
eukprot:scaffold1073_cov98-Cylindrotheca_fusiformis.AAC.8